MKDVRKKLVQSKIVLWSYGCATHCLQNLSMDIEKIPRFTKVVKEALFIPKFIKNNGIIRKLFDALCTEKFGKIYAMMLYSPTRWTTAT